MLGFDVIIDLDLKYDDAKIYDSSNVTHYQLVSMYIHQPTISQSSPFHYLIVTSSSSQIGFITSSNIIEFCK